MAETVTDIIVARAQHADQLSRMVVWSIAGHAAFIALLMLWPDQSASDTPKTIMTVNMVSGAPGPKTGGLTPIGGQTVQAPPPQEAPKPVEAPPAPKTPAMTLPDPKVRPKPQPKVTQAPPDAAARTANTGAEPREGTTRGDTRVRGQGFGLSSSGGSGAVQLDDVADFCCPEYIEQMRVFIQQRWEQNQGITGSTGVKFTILKNGAIQSPQIEKPSGFDALDIAAMRALQRATLPPLPAAFPNPTLTVHMRFDYSR